MILPRVWPQPPLGTVNAIAPGFIDTDMTFGLDDRIKEVALSQVPLEAFWQSGTLPKWSHFVLGKILRTGQVFTVDGGMVMNKKSKLI